MTKKRFLILLLLLVFCAVSVLGCSKGGSSDDDDDEDEPRTTQSGRSDDDDDDGPKGSLSDLFGGKSGDDSGNGADAPDNNDNNTDSQNDNSGDTSPDYSRKNNWGRSDESAELTVYKIGNESLVFVVKGSVCRAMRAYGDRYSGEKTLYLDIESMNLNGELQGKNSWINVGEGDSAKYYYSYAENTFAGRSMYFTRMNPEGGVADFDLSGKYTLVYKDSNAGSSEGDIVAEGDAGSLIKTMTEEEYAKLVYDTFMDGEAETPAKANWTGTYTIEYSYRDNKGWISAEVTEGGLIHFHININDYVRDMFAEEKDYDLAEYVYGKYETADVKVISGGYNREFHYSKDPDSPAKLNVNFSDYDVEPAMYVDENMVKFEEWHVAGADYEDVDTVGFISALDLSQEPFKPVNDDYTITYNTSATVWYDGSYIPCHEAKLCSYDANGMQIQAVTAFIAQNDSDAEKIYKAKQDNAYDYYAVSRSGNIVYNVDIQEDNWYDNKKSNISAVASSTWYIDCHYAYQTRFGDSEYNNSYVYINKPITKAEYNVDLEAGLYWKEKSGKSRRSMDLMDVTLYTTVSNYTTELSIYGSTGFNNIGFGGNMIIRMHGLTAESCAYNKVWASGDYEHYVNFRTYEFKEEETVTTDYFFKVDSFRDMDITFDNFKEKTADYVITQRFDMTREAN